MVNRAAVDVSLNDEAEVDDDEAVDMLCAFELDDDDDDDDDSELLLLLLLLLLFCLPVFL